MDFERKYIEENGAAGGCSENEKKVLQQEDDYPAGVGEDPNKIKIKIDFREFPTSLLIEFAKKRNIVLTSTRRQDVLRKINKMGTWYRDVAA